MDICGQWSVTLYLRIGRILLYTGATCFVSQTSDPMTDTQTATFRFHGRLNYFLPPRQQHQTITHTFGWRASIKDMAESLGPPHAEMALLVVNGHSVDFEYIVQDGDEVEIHDDDKAVDVPDKIALRPPYPGKPRFILDTHLGKLAGYLRMLGFDTLYRNDYPDDVLAEVSHNEQRILLTRDIGVLKRSLVVYGYYMRETDPRKRITEIMTRYDLAAHVEPFKRCAKCNGLLHPVGKAAILDQLPAKTAEFYDEFHQCADCDQVYWKGSHFQRLEQFIDEITGD